MKVECNLVKKISQKTGKPYYQFEIVLPNGYIKRIFPTYEETYIISSIDHLLDE